MDRKTPSRPTAGELEILGVLWKRGSSTVRDIQRILNQERPTGYTTVLKLLQIMAAKGLVRRDEKQRAHVYAARQPREQVQRHLVRDLLERAFEGSAKSLVMQVLAAKKASAPELSEIRRLLDEYERGAK
jgi:BlaI family penicillinase repressor